MRIKCGLIVLMIATLAMSGCDAGGAGAPPMNEVSRVEIADDMAYERARAAPAGSDDRSEMDGEAEQNQSSAQRLIFTGRVILAIYDVESTQIRAIELVDELEGYVSKRSSEQLTVRVPAASFRVALDGLAELGDTLDMTWEAQDVSEQMRDLEIRLKNSLELRDRLETLLARADTVEEALKIETELERITLEVERIRGQLESFEDRVAYSTIVVEFRTIRDDDVPDDDFVLPVAWVNDLGMRSLLQSAGVR